LVGAELTYIVGSSRIKKLHCWIIEDQKIAISIGYLLSFGTEAVKASERMAGGGRVAAILARIFAADSL